MTSRSYTEGSYTEGSYPERGYSESRNIEGLRIDGLHAAGVGAQGTKIEGSHMEGPLAVVGMVRRSAGALARRGRCFGIGSLLLSALIVGSSTSCAPPQPFVWASRLGAPEEQSATYRIGPGDEIYVLVADQQALSGTFTVGPDGGYIQPVVGNIVINGLTTKEAGQQLTARLAGILVRPQVTISVTKRRPIRVSVLGEVQHPGRFELPYEEGILAAVASAGGLTEFADKDSIYVVRREPHLLRIRFRMRDLAGPEATSARFRLNDSDVVVVE